MIIGSLLNIFYLFVAFFIGLLPVSAGIPADWVSSLSLIWGYANAMNYLFPMGTFVAVLAIALVFHVAALGWKLVVWTVHLIRGK